MKKYIFALLIVLMLCSYAYSDDSIYKNGAYWTIDADNKIVNKNGYPPNEELLQENNQTCVYTKDDIPFNEAEYKNGKVVKHTKTTQEIEDELKKQAKADEYKVIHKRMKKIAIDQLESEGLQFKYNHLEE
jgi:hypothetical protein